MDLPILLESLVVINDIHHDVLMSLRFDYQQIRQDHWHHLDTMLITITDNRSILQYLTHLPHQPNTKLPIRHTHMTDRHHHLDKQLPKLNETLIRVIFEPL